MRLIFVFFVLLGPATAFSQNSAGFLIKKINATSEISEKVDLYLELSRHYQYHHPDSAIYFTRQGLELSKKQNYRLGEARLIGQLGTLNEKHDNLELARKYMLESLAIYKELKHTEGIASEYNGLGIIEGKKGNYRAATKYFISSLRLNEKAKNTPGIVQSYIKLGVVNERSGNLDKALDYYQKARALNENEPAALYT
ncbi:MAG TPA: tetratricopeptide repeat protein, partial [Sphingobacteriaceae bacterium]